MIGCSFGKKSGIEVAAFSQPSQAKFSVTTVAPSCGNRRDHFNLEKT